MPIDNALDKFLAPRRSYGGRPVGTKNKPKPHYQIAPERAGDPKAYVEASIKIVNARGAELIKAGDAERDLKMLRFACEANTGVSLKDAARESLGPIERFIGLMESSEPELLEVERAVAAVEDAKIDPEKKKRYSSLIQRTIALQRRVRDDPAKYWVYVGRDQETGGVMTMQRFHLRFFEIWTDPAVRNSIIMAPPKHGKSVCLRGFATWIVGKDPKLRVLVLYDHPEKAGKEINTLKRIIRSGRYRAIFPDVRILERSDGTADSARQFTVARANWMSREATFEGASIRGSINGNRYDRIFCDDICPPQVRYNASLRVEINELFTRVVEERIADPATYRINMIATPWHDEDVHGTVVKDVKEGRLRNWYAAADEFSIKNDPDGRAIPLWADKIGADYLEDRKLRDAQGFTINYRLITHEDKERVVNRLHYYNSVEDDCLSDQDADILEAISDPSAERTLSIDPAASVAKWSSATGVIDGVITVSGYCFITDCEFLKLGPVPMMEWILARIEQAVRANRPYRTVLIEAVAGMKWGASLAIQRINEIIKERKIMPAPEFVAPGVRLASNIGQNPSKLVRLKDCASYVEGGLVRFAGQRRKMGFGRPGITWIESTGIAQLREHLLAFDEKSKSDGVDALTQFILMNQGRISDPHKTVAGPVLQQPKLSPLSAALSRHVEMLMNSALEDSNVYREEAEFLDSRNSVLALSASAA